MATAAAPISIEDYLNTSYSPDREYVEGAVLERNLGKGKHSFVQTKLTRRLDELSEPHNWVVLTEQRTRVSLGRVRIPDVSVVAQLEEITVTPPLLCVEIRSPEDRWSRILGVVSDYHEMGVPCVWVVDPFERRAWIFEADAPPMEVQDDILRASSVDFEVQLSGVLPPA